jgi:predicted DNA-binding transcriptional regulator AlpA
MTDKKVVNWKGLKALGIPFGRTHIWRKMKARTFPRCFKLGEHRNSPPVWWVSEVVEWLEAHAKLADSSP